MLRHYDEQLERSAQLDDWLLPEERLSCGQRAQLERLTVGNSAKIHNGDERFLSLWWRSTATGSSVAWKRLGPAGRRAIRRTVRCANGALVAGRTQPRSKKLLPSRLFRGGVLALRAARAIRKAVYCANGALVAGRTQPRSKKLLPSPLF